MCVVGFYGISEISLFGFSKVWPVGVAALAVFATLVPSSIDLNDYTQCLATHSDLIAGLCAPKLTYSMG